jgi:predicted membrane protein (TIGR00267 family)
LKITKFFNIGKEAGPILRRFFINTLFDSTFMQLGIIIGSTVGSYLELRLIIGTLVTSSIALGISTAVSVYESETMERERRILELEKALFRNLDNTTLTERYKAHAIIIAIVNFFTPLTCCGIVIAPLFLALFQIISTSIASWLSVGGALSILFLAGTYIGRLGKGTPLFKGIRMLFFGIFAFAIGFVIQTII